MSEDDTIVATSPVIDPPNDPAAVPPRWPKRVRRGAWGMSAVGLVVALALLYRYISSPGALDPATNGRELVPLILALLVFALALAVVIFRPEEQAVRRMIATAAMWTVCLSAAIGAMWLLMIVWHRDDTAVGTPVHNDAEVVAYLANHVAARPGGPGLPRLPIPTGILIQSIDLPTPQQVDVSGYLWQAYLPIIPADVTRGVALPEAVADGFTSEEIARVTEDGVELIAWHFRATFRRSFDFRHYPFDRQEVALLLWHSNLDPRVILVPDFTSFPSLDAVGLPSLASGFSVAGWSPEYAGFSYDIVSGSAGSGAGSRLTQVGIPQLYFTVGLQRNFLGPFFNQIAFAQVVALLLFAVLCLTAREESTKSRVGMSTFGVLGTCSGLLFAVIVKHGELREAIAPDQLVYLEILPFLLNVAIVLVALNAILLASPLHPRVLAYKNNLLPDLVFWPLFLSLLLIATVSMFYQ